MSQLPLMLQRLRIEAPGRVPVAPMVGQDAEIRQGFGELAHVAKRAPQAQRLLQMALSLFQTAVGGSILQKAEIVANDGRAQAVSRLLELLQRPLKPVARLRKGV